MCHDNRDTWLVIPNKGQLNMTCKSKGIVCDTTITISLSSLMGSLVYHAKELI